MKSIICLTITCFLPCSLHAWGPGGHKVIALVAYEQLSTQQRVKVIEILKHHPRFNEDFDSKMPEEIRDGNDSDRQRWLFAQAAIWPDMARSLPAFHHSSWHYFNSPLFLDAASKAAMQNNLEVNLQATAAPNADPKDLNAPQALGLAVNKLKELNAGEEEKAVLLCWIFHLVGDLHQPLHCVAMFSEHEFPDTKEGDRGGNRILIAGGNLHSFWDGLLGFGKRLNDVRRRASDIISDDAIKAEAVAASTELTPMNWITEGKVIAEKSVYDSELKAELRGQTPQEQGEVGPIEIDESYKATAGELARSRVGIAGYRLAKLIGETLQ